ncbi:MAG: tRNA pseudouridine(13) synthase TruD [Candidatus Altiarchaeota archaeon]
MKLKQVPEDFKVFEEGEFKTSEERGDYKLYSLEKRGLETFALLGHLSKKNGIPISKFGFAGLKDRHAVTTQYLTVPSEYGIITLAEKNFRLEFQGYLDRSIRLGDLKGNGFEITVRDLKKNELSPVYERAESITRIGVPNYFDSQRFGSVVNGNFIIKSVMRGEYENAVKAFLTAYTKSEKASVKERKRLMLRDWDRITELELSEGRTAAIVGGYKRTGDWLDAYRRIPSNMREIFVSTYQSHIWNRCLEQVLLKEIDRRRLYPIRYSLGTLLFYKNISDEEVNRLPETFKTVSHDMKPAEYEQTIIDGILADEGVRLEDFDIRSRTGNFFKSHERRTTVKPEDFSISPPTPDELNRKTKVDRHKINLKFRLPKGSYATIITKRLFNK